MNVTYSKSELKQQIEDSTFEVSKDLISEFSLWLAEYILMNLYDDREDQKSIETRGLSKI